jgi:hypothetical protein
MTEIAHMMIDIPGATPDEIRRGLEAAQKVLDDSGINAYCAMTHHCLRELYLAFPITVPYEGDHDAAEAWNAACHAAVDACCAGWPPPYHWPLGALRLSDGYAAMMRVAYPELAATADAVDRELLSDR